QPRTGELTGQPRTHPEPNTPYGKLIKIEFPKFSGGDVKDWIYRCKKFFKVDGVVDGKKVQLASMHVFDAALVWYQQYMKKYPDNTPWEHFEVEVVKRFEVLYDDPIVELKKLELEVVKSKVVTTLVKSNSVGQSSGYVTRNETFTQLRSWGVDWLRPHLCKFQWPMDRE
nr:gypsy/Ty3 retroelement polyprotein [Tanacetum cinerariifolium]